MKKIIFVLMVLMAIPAWGGENSNNLLDNDENFLLVEVSSNIKIGNYTIGQEDILKMSDKELTNFVLLINVFQTGAWFGQDVIEKLAQKYLPSWITGYSHNDIDWGQPEWGGGYIVIYDKTLGLRDDGVVVWRKIKETPDVGDEEASYPFLAPPEQTECGLNNSQAP